AGAGTAAEHQPLQQAGLAFGGVGHVDHAVRAVAFAVAAADAVVGDEYLAVRRAVDRVRRAVLHAVRVFAVPAGGRHVDFGEGRAGFAVEPRGAGVGFRAGLFAVVATHAQGFVDEQDVGRLAGALREQEADQVAAARHREHRQIGRGALLVFLLQAHLEDRVARDEALERLAVEAHGLGRDRGARGGRTFRVAEQGHLADVVAG